LPPQLPPFVLPSQPPLQTPAPQFPEPEPQINPQASLRVNRFIFEGNTVISTQELEKVTAPYQGKVITVKELQQVRDTVAKVYHDRGYLSTRSRLLALPANQGLQAAGTTITIAIFEGTVEQINYQGSPRLRRYMVRRIKAATSPVYNEDRLLEELRLLQDDPLIKQIAVQKYPGSRKSTTVLTVQVQQTQRLRGTFFLDNNRSPAIGSWQRGLQLEDTNLLGLGDRLSFYYANTTGSNEESANYSVPFNISNGTVQFSFTNLNSRIVEKPFNQLDITSNARSYDLSIRQPLLRTANETSIRELAVGLTASRVESETALLDTPFPLAAGADEQGRTRLSVLRFFQEYIQRDSRQVLSARSQFNLGLGAFDATIHPTAPDGHFFYWQGQGVWQRLLSQKLTFQARGALQIADRSLPALEQFALGGATTVRGYREQGFLGDEAVLASVELDYPVLSSSYGTVRVGPFIDTGRTWGTGSSDLASRFLASAGVGVKYSLAEQLSVRLDAAIPLISFSEPDTAWRGNTLSFFVNYNF